MKNLFTTRWSDGRLMRYDGATWTLAGSYTPPADFAVSPTAPINSVKAHSCFVYRGKLYARYTGWKSATNNPTVTIAEFDGTNLVQKIYHESTLGDNNILLGPVFQYKGRCYWFDHFGSISTYNNLYINSFWFDGSGVAQFTRVLATEFGSLIRIANDTQTSHVGHYASPIIKPFRDRVMLTPGVSPHNYSSGEAYVWTYMAAFDVDPASGIITSAIHMSPDNSKRFLRFNQNVPDLTYVTALDQVYSTVTPWRDKVYGLTYAGKLYAYNPDNGTRALVYDFGGDSSFVLNNDVAYVTDSTSGSYTIYHASGSSAGLNGSEWQHWPMNGALKIKILNFGGTPGNTKWGWVAGSVGTYFIDAYDEVTGAKLASQPSGTQYKLYWGFHPSPYGTSNYRQMNVHSFIWNNKLYIIREASRRQDSQSLPTDSKFHHPFVIMVYDGTNPPTTYKYTDGSTTSFNLNACTFEVEEYAGVLHMFGHNVHDDGVRWYRFDLNSNPPPMTAMGVVYTKPNEGPADIEGFPLDAFVAYDPGDVTATIDSRTHSDVTKTITINYKLWATAANTADIAVEYSIGSDNLDWVAASRKSAQGEGTTGLAASSTGTAHTFVHDINTDFPLNYAGSMQHRIRVVSQTRV